MAEPLWLTYLSPPEGKLRRFIRNGGTNRQLLERVSFGYTTSRFEGEYETNEMKRNKRKRALFRLFRFIGSTPLKCA
jgi:hypothetical protein